MVVLVIEINVFIQLDIFLHGYNEITERDRCCFHQNSIYKREYHYQNKIEDINTKCNLEMTSDEKYELLLKLQKIDVKKN